MDLREFGRVIGLALVVCAASARSARTVDAEPPAAGPTLELGYRAESLPNTVDSFMYFVPLTSLTAVSTTTDPNTNFTAGIVSRRCENKRNNRFDVSCDFEIVGSGLYRVMYDPVEMINLVSNGQTDKRCLKNLLDWIQIDGPCLGRVQAQGYAKDDEVVVEKVTVSFTRDGQKSPVSIALYDVPRKNNRYDYANRENPVAARVNTLTFSRSEKEPRMSVEVASVQKAGASEGMLSSIKAMFANLLLAPLPVSVVGNKTMLDFGQALYLKKTAFTFPVAETLRPSLAKAQVSTF
ncbi:MAG: hypothetical protein GX298_10245 [Planctomycetes bacterium]|nr:hypothetical protein [Planctomycetota bacterium]